jgi:hypothetical protein
MGGAGAGVGDQPLEAVEVQLAGPQLEQVARRPGHQQLAGSPLRPLGQQAPQPQDVVLQGGAGAWRRGLVPQVVDQLLGRHDLVGVQQQGRQQRPLQGRADRHRPAVGPHL